MSMLVPPDPRFSLANQRTYLSWVRTSLGLLAGGVALEVIGLDLHSGLRLAAALVLVIAGILTMPLAWLGWRRNERAMRVHDPLPASLLGPFTGLAVTSAGVLVLLAILF